MDLGCVDVRARGGCVASWAGSVCAGDGACGFSVEGGMDGSGGREGVSSRVCVPHGLGLR